MRWRWILSLVAAPLALASALAAAEEPSTVYACHEVQVAPAKLGIPPDLDPYDPAAVSVDAVITSPTGDELRQPCFHLVPQETWTQTAYQAEQRKDMAWERFRDAGDGRWCLRFSPPG